MSGSNVEETSEQTRGREMEHTTRGRGRKDKSRDALANMEARLAMVDTRDGVDLIEQGMKKGLKNLREQIQDLYGGMLVSQVHSVSHEEFMSFQDKVMTSQGWRPWLHAWMPETKRFVKSWPSTRLLCQHESWPLMRHQGWRCPSHTRSVARGMLRSWTTSYGT